VDKEIALLPLQPRLLNYFAAEFAALQAIDLMNCTTTGLLNALLALPSLSNLLDVRSLALVEDLLRLDAEIEMAQVPLSHLTSNFAPLSLCVNHRNCPVLLLIHEHSGM